MLLGLLVLTRHHPIEGSIGRDLGAIEIEFLAPNESRLLAAFDKLLEETLENDEPVAVADFAEAAVVRHSSCSSPVSLPSVTVLGIILKTKKGYQRPRQAQNLWQELLLIASTGCTILRHL